MNCIFETKSVDGDYGTERLDNVTQDGIDKHYDEVVESGGKVIGVHILN